MVPTYSGQDPRALAGRLVKMADPRFTRERCPICKGLCIPEQMALFQLERRRDKATADVRMCLECGGKPFTGFNVRQYAAEPKQ